MMGFEPQGENLSLIMIDNKGESYHNRRFIIEHRIDELIDELHIDPRRIVGVSHKSSTWKRWDTNLIATTVLVYALNIIPYVYINRSANNLNWDRGTLWLFPILRSTGGVIIAILTPLLIIH